jgi:replicative DNA helicase
MNAPEAIRMPPSSMEAEQAVLGALMIDPTAIDRLPRLVPGEFFDAQHALLYQAVLDCAEVGEPCDPVTLHERVERNEPGRVDFGYLTQLATQTPSAANVATYARIVQERALSRRLIVAAARVSELAWSAQPVREQIDAAQREILAVTSETASEPKSVAQLASGYRAMLRERAEGRVKRVLTHLSDLDRQLCGLHGGDLAIIGARTSVGKSLLGVQIALRCATQAAQSALVCSLEMSAQDVLDRLAANHGNLPLREMISGAVLRDSRIDGVLEALGNAKLHIDHTAALSVFDVAARARGIKRRCGLDVLVIDYLQLMSAEGDSRNEALASVTRGLKALARELDIVVIALAQLNREVDRNKRKPLLSDLRDCGAIEQDADVVLLLHRDDFNNADSPERGTCEIIIAKHRQGARGSVRVSARDAYARFDDLAPDWQPGMMRSPQRERGFSYEEASNGY